MMNPSFGVELSYLPGFRDKMRRTSIALGHLSGKALAVKNEPDCGSFQHPCQLHVIRAETWRKTKWKSHAVRKPRLLLENISRFIANNSFADT
jgi:hypothetical protein